MADMSKMLKSTFMNRTFLLSTATFVVVSIILAGIFSFQASGSGLNKDYIMDYDKAIVLAGIASTNEKMASGELEMKNEVLTTITGNVGENSEDSTTIKMDKEGLVNITFVLTWQDEAPDRLRYTNTPDNLGLKVIPPTGEADAQSAGPTPNAADGSGSVTLTISVDPKKADQMVGDWTVIVVAGECGDQEPIFNVLGLRAIADTGNDYSVEVTVDYYG